MKKIFMAIAIIMAVSGCTNEGDAIKVLKQSGFKEIRTDGYGWFACGRDDSFSTSFYAKAPNGDMVNGTVCSGFFKGNTIRLD